MKTIMIKTTSSSGEDYYKNIFSAICDKDGFMTKTDILDILVESGISNDDPRITKLIAKLNKFCDIDKIDFDTFQEITFENIGLIEKAINKGFIIPNFKDFKKEIEAIYNETKKNETGRNANYIPQLARVDPNLFAVAFCSVDGQIITLGDYLQPYCVQSTAKTITYCIATEENGEDKVHQHVGREPSGITFNAIALNKYDLPHNPMINSGAIMMCSLIKPEWNLADRFEYITNVWQDLAGGEPIGFDNAVYHSEKETADRNYALAHFMKEVGAFPEGTNIHTALDFYFQTCSIQVNAKKMAKIMASIANGGVCPFTSKKIFSPTTIRNCLSMMYSCGMYDFSGEYAFSVGLPAKSGVSGALAIAIPNVGGFAIFSPRLDPNHNSVRGVEFSKRLIEKFSFHNYDHITHCDKINPVENRMVVESNLTFELIWAASAGDLSEIKRAVALGVDINKGDYDKRTALHLAAAEGHEDIVKYLIRKGADINAIDRWGKKPLDDAIMNNNISIIELLDRT
ncbi:MULTISPECIES: glutaminase A [Francisella]|uniref:Glutaminase n=3 Tax=Francisella tularensis TaxID=263 RepID=Q5NI86_FRATT|nr:MULTISPECIES: glutaminase A [Francisella]ABO47545.1 Glutaminase/Ankyrin repeat protein [Francisella tularensis subsp. tularensis WY96-3418]ADA77883.1 Glutaminase/Ankyrin repeat protein [Francisella tularensis subsp. tularensis NE061598]AFB78316.1 Glutaminase [Francisella tularensis subsp. tularensis TIGB03]AFB79940.1 Glutaminase [Francisella tularensis subsp. tularensis TI0902]AJI63725.1 glutaminase A [Francisella tularensis subsp. tularensis]